MKTNYIITLIIACGSMALLPSHAQQVVIIDGYTAISAEGYSQGMKATIFKNVSLGDQNAAEKVQRQERHTEKENTHISPLFAIAPTDINATGAAVNIETKITWAQAAGWGDNANTTINTVPQFALERGCPAYRGKNTKDTPGAWRIPTNRELHLMNQLKIAMDNTSGDTGFKPCSTTEEYWTSTEIGKDLAFVIKIIGTMNHDRFSRSSQSLARCVKDLPVPAP